MLFTDSFLRGGTERQFVRLVRSLHRAGHNLLIGCLHRHGPLLSEIESLGLRIVEFPINSLYNFKAAKLFIQLVQLLRRERVQILHAFGFYTSVFTIPAARLAGVPVALASRRELLNLRGAWQQRAIRFACSLATGVVVNSHAARNDVISHNLCNRKLVELLPNCIDLEEFKPRREAKEMRQELGIVGASIVVGALANLRPEKDLGTFLLAARGVLDVNPLVEFLVIGDGPEKASLSRLANDLNLIRSVHFLSDRSDVPDLIAALDVVVMCSSSESFPNAILEAMALGVPVVATAVGGMPELVMEGRTGFLVPPKDAEAVAKRILYLCRHPHRRLQMGLSAHRRVENDFTVQQVVKTLESIYARALLAGSMRPQSKSTL
jgi:glycosyltransferase involved in cell wall biosynthesis